MKTAAERLHWDIEAAMDALTHWPAVGHVKRLSQHAYGYRLRVGDDRILFDVRDTLRMIAVQEVKKRDEHTY